MIARAIDDVNVIAQVLQPLGMACLGEGDLAAARGHLEEALDRARLQQEPRSIAAAINAMAQFHRVQKAVDMQPLLERARSARRLTTAASPSACSTLPTWVERGAADHARPAIVEALGIAQATGSSPPARACSGVRRHGRARSDGLRRVVHGAAKPRRPRASSRPGRRVPPGAADGECAHGLPPPTSRGCGRARARPGQAPEARAWLDEGLF